MYLYYKKVANRKEFLDSKVKIYILYCHQQQSSVYTHDLIQIYTLKTSYNEPHKLQLIHYKHYDIQESMFIITFNVTIY
jgi:hypothetical protein